MDKQTKENLLMILFMVVLGFGALLVAMCSGYKGNNKTMERGRVVEK